VPSRQPIRSESGFTIVEVMVAALILVIGAAALMTALAGARKATYRGEQSQVANDIAQREMEALRATPYTKLAMTSTPGHSTDQSDPRYRVSSGNFDLTGDDADPDPAPMVVDGGTLVKGGTVSGGTINPGPQPFTSGDVSGTIQRFVVWQNDQHCDDNLLCPGNQDFKRLIVFVTLDTTGSGGVRQYVELQSDAINPTDSVGSNPNLPQLGTPTVAQQFWLSDRRCEQFTEPARATVAPMPGHSTHDTRGLNCLGTTADRPDALLTSAPDEFLDIVDTLDYATDLEPTPADADAGLQLDLPAANGCDLLPASRPANQEHFWVSQPVNKTSPYVLKGGTTLKLFTRTINDVQVSGKLCVVVFLRTEAYADATTTVPATTDVQLAAGSVSKPNWASDDWEELTIPMQFTPSTIPVVSPTFPKDYKRIGVVIGLDKQGGASNQFQFQYDTVRFDSRLEVETTTPIG
jgi:type II secretory pathway pseudopilin PulG